MKKIIFPVLSVIILTTPSITLAIDELTFIASYIDGSSGIDGLSNANSVAVSAGVKLYQIKAGDFVQTKKMVLLK